MSVRARPLGRRVAVALVLTLGPTLALAYFAYRSVAERERNLSLTYSATGALVRDRFSAELTALNASLLRDAASWPAVGEAPEIQHRLRTLAAANPWIEKSFIVAADGRATSALVSRGWDSGRRTSALSPRIREAESFEFIAGDLGLALRAYSQAAATATAVDARALAMSRVGRTLFKMGEYDKGIAAYRAVIESAGTASDDHGIPYHVSALLQVIDGLERMGRQTEHADAIIELARSVLDQPWDLDEGYGYYVERARQLAREAELPVVFRRLLDDMSSAVTDLEWMAKAVSAFVDERTGPSRFVAADRGSERVALAVHRIAPALSLVSVVRIGFVSGALLQKVSAGVELPAETTAVLRPDNGPDPHALAIAPLNDVMPGWSVALIDQRGRTLAQITAWERWTYGALVAGVLITLVIGVIFTTRAWTREAELAQLQTDFVSNVSHELKTPLALIRMFGETLESGLVSDDTKRREFYGVIRRESERLTHLINNVLDAARIEAGSKQFTLTSGDMAALVREALDAYSPLFNRLSFAVDVAIPDRPCPVWMDRDAVAQALVNLFQNAIRYSGDARHVAVSVNQSEQEISVSVADRGIGIAARDLARIFDRFYRAGRGASEPAGSGLGLSIVKHVMNAHGGRVDVQSQPGHGSVFTLVFPAERSAA